MTLTKDQQAELFMRRFNCACLRIVRAGKPIMSGSVSYGRVTGDMIRRDLFGCWRIREQYVDVHPLCLMLDGRRALYINPLRQLDKHYEMTTDCIASAFAQGFIDAPHYRDVWQGYDIGNQHPSYYMSLMFHLGRAMLNKFRGHTLSYTLPPKFATLFKELPNV